MKVCIFLKRLKIVECFLDEWDSSRLGNAISIKLLLFAFSKANEYFLDKMHNELMAVIPYIRETVFSSFLIFCCFVM